MQQNMLLVLLLMGLLASVATAAVAGPLSTGLAHQAASLSQPQALDEEHEDHGDHDHGMKGHQHHEEEEHEEEQQALGQLELHGVINRTSIAGLGLGNFTQIEAKLSEGKRAHIEVHGGGEASLNVTGVSVDAVGGKVTITAKVLHSDIEGIDAGDTLTIVVTLTQANITDQTKNQSAQVLVTKLELKLP